MLNFDISKITGCATTIRQNRRGRLFILVFCYCRNVHQIFWRAPFDGLSASVRGIKMTAIMKSTLAGQPLTRREREVCLHIARGESNKQIAHILNVSPNTVMRYVFNSMRKTRCLNRAHLAVVYTVQIAPAIERQGHA
jgi:DNA-binding CsgD family transcriptional regulator